jgi:hypothetical protein
MGENQSEVRSKESSLETLIDDEIYRAPGKCFFKKLKQRIEKTIAHHKNAVIVPISAAVGGGIGFIAKKTIESTVYLLDQLGRQDISLVFANKHNLDHLIFGVLGGGVTYLALDYIARKQVGKRICGIKEVSDDLKKKRENFVLRHRLGLALTTGTAFLGLIANRFYQSLNMPLQQVEQVLFKNYDKSLVSIAPIALEVLGAFYFIYDQVGKFTALKTKDANKSMLINITYALSKQAGIKLAEKESKKGNLLATQFLSRVKKNLDEKLELRKKVIDNQEKHDVYYGKEFGWAKPYSIGSDYFSLKGKKDLNILLDMAMKLYDVNPARAILLINKLANGMRLDTKLKIIITRDYFLNKHGKDAGYHWEEFFQVAEHMGLLQSLPSTEGKVQFFKEDEYINKNFIFKTYSDDRTEKFLTEYFIWKKSIGSVVKAEQPLLCYNVSDNVQRHIIVRAGLETLSEKLKKLAPEDKRDLMKEMLPKILAYQELVFSALENSGSGYVINAEFRGESRQIIVPRLELARSIKQRAFYGYRKGEERLGVNEFLPPLIEKIYGFVAEKYHVILPTVNHGDIFGGRNVMADGTIIDSKLTFFDAPYDAVSFVLGPEVLDISFASRKEDVLEALLKKDPIRKKEQFLGDTYDALFLSHAWSLSGSRFFYGFHDEAELLINELIQFSKDKGFMPELKPYLKNSRASELYAVRSL